MTRIVSSFGMLLLLGAAGRHAPDPEPLRILTYNIHHGEGTDGVFDLPRIATIVSRTRPDLVALQEVDQGTDRAGGVDQLAELARLTGLHGQFGKAMDYANGSYGVGVLSRWPLFGAHNRPLPGTADREPRTALTVHVKPGDGGPVLRFTSTHFDQGRDEQNRLAQAAYLTGHDTDGGLPALLAGDLNSRPDTDVIRTLEARWTNALTIGLPPFDERRRLRGDYVLFRPADGWRVVESTIIDDRIASDHRPVLVVLEWMGPR